MKRIYIYLLLVGLLSSCSKFLEMKSPSEYVPKTVEALSEMLIGGAYPSDKNSGSLFSFNDFLSRDVVMYDGEYDVNAKEMNIGSIKPLYSWHPDVQILMRGPSYTNSYEKYYAFIMGCNAVFDYIDTVEGEELAKNKVMAEAYTLRAFYYLHLVNLYAKPYSWDKTAPGVPLKLSSQLDIKDMARNSVEEVYEQILSDLDAAYELLKTLPEAKSREKSLRISLPVIEMLYTRVYLYMENWAEVVKWSEEFMKNNLNVQLYDLNAFVDSNPIPTDPLVKITYPVFTSLGNSETIWMYGSSSSTSTHYVGVIKEIRNPDNRITKPNVPLFVASTELRNSYDEGDYRKQLYFVKVWDNIKGRPIYAENMYYTYSKCAISDASNSQLWGDGAFVYSMRLSELYLNYAEALTKLGGGTNETKAVQIIDKLRQNRIARENYSSIGTLTGDELFSFIKEERRRELCFELHSWYDSRRWNEGYSKNWYFEDDVTFKIEKNSPAFVLQIPMSSMDANQKLTQNEKPLAQY